MVIVTLHGFIKPSYFIKLSNASPEDLGSHVTLNNIQCIKTKFASIKPLKLYSIRTVTFKSSYYPFCLTKWNKFCEKIRKSNFLHILMKQLQIFITTKLNFVPDIHDPVGIYVLTSVIKINFSGLNKHKF